MLQGYMTCVQTVHNMHCYTHSLYMYIHNINNSTNLTMMKPIMACNQLVNRVD